MDYGLNLLSTENIELKMSMLSLLIKKSPRTLETLMELGSKHAVQSSLYDLEQEGFITRRIKENIFSYEFNRAQILFKIKKTLETTYEKLNEDRNYYTTNVLFHCKICNKLFEYTYAMEHAFKCCGEQMNSFDSSRVIREIMENMTFIESKLSAFDKVLE